MESSNFFLHCFKVFMNEGCETSDQFNDDIHHDSHLSRKSFVISADIETKELTVDTKLSREQRIENRSSFTH